MLSVAGLVAGCAAPQAGPAVRPNPTNATPVTASVTPLASTTARVPATAPDPAIAFIGSTVVTADELRKPLLEAYGFNLLMLIVQRDMARDACRQQNMVVTADDTQWEYDWTLQQMFPNVESASDRENLLDQFLAQPKPKDQTTTRVELGIIVETNAYMRKLVAPSISRGVTDEMLKQQFDESYGAQVQVRHIVVDNPQDAQNVRRRLDAGEDFAAVARQASRDPRTRPLGGELAPFTINSTRLPENFKRVAFSLKPGEISDPVQAGGGYHLIQLQRRVEPKVVKFDDVKGSLRQDYESKMVMEGVKALRGRLAQQALAELKITDPILKAEFEKRMAGREALIRDRDKMRDQMEKDREAARTQPATQAAVRPTTAATPPAPRPAAVVTPATPATRPVATQPPATAPAVPFVPPSPEKRVIPPATRPAATQPVAPTTAPAAPAPAVAPSPEKRPAPATRPASTPAVDPTTGLPLASDGRVRTGVAPIGVVQNSSNNFVKPEKLDTGVNAVVVPSSQPAATRPAVEPAFVADGPGGKPVMIDPTTGLLVREATPADVRANAERLKAADAAAPRPSTRPAAATRP